MNWSTASRMGWSGWVIAQAASAELCRADLEQGYLLAVELVDRQPDGLVPALPNSTPALPPAPPAPPSPPRPLRRIHRCRRHRTAAGVAEQHTGVAAGPTGPTVTT
nr:hypothetical protein [Mycobacterium tuberculosis]